MIFIYAFLPLCILAYWLARSLKAKNYVLLAASMVFYGLGEPLYIFLMLAAAGSAFSFSQLIDRYRGTRTSKVFLVISVAVNVSFLFFFKYMPLFVETASNILRLNIRAPRITLPIGISFYTFQILTYTIDVYRNKTKLQKSPLSFLLYVSMFPQLIAGPIVRYDDVARQLDKRYVDAERLASGIIRFICGLAKKVLLADYAGVIADKLLGAAVAGAAATGAATAGAGAAAGAAATGAAAVGGAAAAVGGAAAASQGVLGFVREGLGVTAGSLGANAGTFAGSISTMGAWCGLLFFAFQIYFDFSGYSDMAIGLGRMFGFEFMENFRYPYGSKSITEFWRRWHMSLGTFFRDYVYIPLGGNRRYQLRNIAIVWVLTGFWHGASWNFVIWGCYFGIILIAEKYLSRIVRVKIPAFISWVYCFSAVIIGWSVFYYTDLGQVRDTLAAMFRYRPELSFQTVGLVKDNLFFLAVCLFASMPWAKQIYERILYWAEGKNGQLTAVADSALSFAYMAVLLFACSAVRVGSSFSPFLYFRF